MCETPLDLGIKWSRWHTLLFEEQVAVDMRVVCPLDVHKMLLKQHRTVHWKKWAAKHECEELKEGVWRLAGANSGDGWKEDQRIMDI